MQIERIPEWALTAVVDGEIADLLARCFTTDFGGRSFFQTRHHLRLVQRGPDGALWGHMALQWRAMRLGETLITVAGLAEVATSPDHRGQGIAGRLLQAAIAEAEASPARFLLLFGTAKLYAAAGFRPVQNPMVWADLQDARTHHIRRERADSLMVLPLGGAVWEDEATLDLLGNLF